MGRLSGRVVYCVSVDMVKPQCICPLTQQWRCNDHSQRPILWHVETLGVGQALDQHICKNRSEKRCEDQDRMSFSSTVGEPEQPLLVKVLRPSH